ncbi:hypothetical protein C1X72_26385 [Pseudomonas sp. FW306-2-2C-D06B]|nr:hypothetical protein C1X72_26385 [Pseudomonas sp. FW306-2-2C-D06B]PNA92069.1 hypothetical protein C1X74_23765 [Pseudomonas sp. GW460-5]PNB58396.1 hypothetical protein C1X73_13870 [Pseudomonas sp. FW305-130]
MVMCTAGSEPERLVHGCRSGFCVDLARPLRGLARSHRYCIGSGSNGEPVGAGEPAKAATRFRRSPAG